MLATPHSDHLTGDEMSDGQETTSLVGLQITQAVTNQKVEELVRMVAEIKNDFRDFKANYATKAEIAEIQKDVDKLQSWNKWLVQIVGGLIISAIIGTIIIKGGR